MWSALSGLCGISKRAVGAVSKEDGMGQRRYTPEQIIAKLREMEVLVAGV